MRDIILDRKNLVEKIISSVTSTYGLEISDAKLSDAAISALGETVARVPEHLREENPVTKNRFRTPEALYLWAVANADMVFPYLSLKQAEEHLKISLYAPQPWGYKDDHFHLPKVESLFPDSRTWILLSEILRSRFGSDKVTHDSDAVDSVPSLSNDIVEKQPALNTIIIRILELMKNPLSVTIRKEGLEKAEVAIRNAVDFVLIDEIYQRSEIYENLTLSGIAVTSGRRARKVEVKGAANRIGYNYIYQGYKLSELLSLYIDNKSSKEKSPEHEPFVAMILALLRNLVPSDLEGFELPKHIFEAPSNQLRSMVREGPQIKTKKGLRHNLYVPFSFVRAAECASYPEVIRKELIDIGGGVVKHLDSINKTTLTEANISVPFYKEYLSLVYILSDECRKEWRQRAYTPDAERLRRCVLGEFDRALASEDEDYTLVNYLENFKAALLSGFEFHPAKSSETEQRELASSVKEIVSQRMNARGNAVVRR
jgi:hypothetical protein